MKNNLQACISGFILSNISMLTGWIKVETAIEVAVYGFIGGVAGVLGRRLIQFTRFLLQSVTDK